MSYPPPPNQPPDEGRPGGYGPPPGGSPHGGRDYGDQTYGARPPYGEERVPGDYGTPQRMPYPLAEWWRRLLARLVDGLVLLIPLFVVAGLILLPSMEFDTAPGPMGTAPGPGVGPGPGFGASLLFAVVWFVLLVGYDTLLHAKFGRTVGKMVLRIQVVPIGGSGRPGELETGPAMLRAVIWYISALVNPIPFLGFLASLFTLLNGLWPLWDKPYQQALHDKPAKTVVVHTG